jgi:hypothetical protein
MVATTNHSRPCGAHQASYTVDAGDSTWVKLPDRVSDHSPPLNAEVKNARIYSCTPHVRLRECGARYESVPKISGLATWSENCKWYSSLPLGAVVSLFCESV